MKWPLVPVKLWFAYICVLIGGLTPFHTANATTPTCDAAAEVASTQHGVPLNLMRAITRVETARQDRPDPWAVNVADQGFRFESGHSARTFVEALVRGGKDSVDIGCFQINYRWHGQHFASVGQMFLPNANADYAARFLKELHAETGNWLLAAGRYHSQTERHAKLYRAKVAKVLKRLGGERSNTTPQSLATQIGTTSSLFQSSNRRKHQAGAASLWGQDR